MTSSTTCLIEVRNLSKIFHRGEERVVALDGVSLAIAAGEFVAVTGPSGCGKSTLMYILGLLDIPSSGEYRLEGVATSVLTDRERARIRNQKIGFVFQSFHLLPRATALRNVMMPLVYRAGYDSGVSNKQMREMAGAILEEVGLGKRLNHLPQEMSGGERQRVAIARALVNQPSLLLADEPTGNLDSRSGEGILRLFGDLHAKGITIVMVTHDRQIAASAPRRVAFVDGRIVNQSVFGGGTDAS